MYKTILFAYNTSNRVMYLFSLIPHSIFLFYLAKKTNILYNVRYLFWRLKMDKNNECLKSKKAFHWEGVILLLIIISSVFIYIIIIRPYITAIQWDLLCNSQTLLLIPSSGLWALLEVMSGMVFIITIYVLIMYKIEQRRTIEIDKKAINKKKSGTKWFVITMLICIVPILISTVSYCRIDRDAIYVREIRTLFVEKEYSWDAVNSVEINYLHSRKTRYNLQYLLNFDKFSINVRNPGISTKIELMNDAQKTIHDMVKIKNIQVSKHIVKYDNEINKFLDLIGE